MPVQQCGEGGIRALAGELLQQGPVAVAIDRPTRDQGADVTQNRLG